MSKNPFVNCKSRKRRKARDPIPKPQEKLFCPRTMVRYDDSPSGYSPIWACKMCLRCILSEDAVKNHLIRCNASTKKDTSSTQQTKKNEDVHYTCDTCQKVFSRRVALKKHLETHDKSSSGLESEQSDNETAEKTADIPEDAEVTEADLVNEKNDKESEELNANDLANDLI